VEIGTSPFEVEPVQTNMVFARVPADRCAALKEHLAAAGVTAHEKVADYVRVFDMLSGARGEAGGPRGL
jgi:hypothetical protein